MVIQERTVEMAQNRDVAQASEVGWFAARQPGLLRFIEDRVGSSEDAMAMAVDMCWRVTSAFERQRGLPLPRISSAELERAEVEVMSESQGGLSLATGCAHRQPELCHWLEDRMVNAALPIDKSLLDQVALITAATISACDWAAHPAPRAIDDNDSIGVLVE
jgi:hypothetical protein